MSNVAGIDLYGTSDAATIVTNIPYKGVSEFKQVLVGSGSRSFAVRITGVTTTQATVSIAPVAGRMYTVFAYGVMGKGGTRAPKATFYTSRFQTYEF
jgi:hypothetical protein